jgi:tetratricopeptide (TPR) repeat protein
MAVALNAISIIARLDAVSRSFPGGREAFLLNIPNSMFCSDEDLIVSSFMVETDAREFMQELRRLGLTCYPETDSTVVLVNAFQFERAELPEWLEIGKYQNAVIGWLAGAEIKTIHGPPDWDPEDDTLQFATVEEAAKRLEFLRRDGSVEVYRDRQTGQELYTARTNLPLDEMFKEAGEIVTKNMIHPGQAALTGEQAATVFRAVEMLEIITERVSDSWRAFWLLAKGEHAIGKPLRAYEGYKSALALEPDEINILRELGGVCLELGRGTEAVTYAEQAVCIDPGSPELLGNLAMAHLIAGNVPAAQKTIHAARNMNSSDRTNTNIEKIITDVAKGRRASPKNLREAVSQKIVSNLGLSGRVMSRLRRVFGWGNHR